MRPRSFASYRLGRGLMTVLLAAALACRDDTAPPTAPDVPEPLAVSAASAPAFHQVSAGGVQTCGVTTDNRAYCWGFNATGAIGDGTTTTRLTPVAVVGGLRFRQVDAGPFHSCGVTTDFRAYCWGLNRFGGLGDGTTETRLQPVPVAGGRQFRAVDVGEHHTCAWTDENRVYCWGLNSSGQLGNGTNTGPDTCEFNACSTRPVAVSGGLRFRTVGAGGAHTCGVTTGSLAYCWGSNGFGQIGDNSTVVRRLRPSAVDGARRFRQVDAGQYHSCGVTTDDRAFCWGNGRSGQIGDGKAFLRFSPRRVAGGLSIARVSAEGRYTCGETTQNRAYCWGENTWGQLGDGTTIRRLTPVAVAGGLSFSQVSAGSEHTCGRTPSAVAYCWGLNAGGALGNGTTTDSPTPVAVGVN